MTFPSLEGVATRINNKLKHKNRKTGFDSKSYQYAGLNVDPGSANIGVSATATRELPEMTLVIPPDATVNAPPNSQETAAQPEAESKPLIEQAKEKLKEAAIKGEGQFKVLQGSDFGQELTKRIDAKLQSSPDLQRDTEPFNKEAAALRKQLEAENQQRQQNVDFVNGDLQNANQYGIVEKKIQMPSTSGIMRESSISENVNTQIQKLLMQLNEEGEILARKIDARRMIIEGNNLLDHNQFLQKQISENIKGKSRQEITEEANARFDKEAIVVDEQKKPENTTTENTERQKVQETTIKTAEELLIAWENNDDLVIIDKKDDEIKLEGRKPVHERGRLGILIATYESTTLPEAKSFLYAEIHKLLRKQQLNNPSANSDLDLKLGNLAQNDQLALNIQDEAFDRVTALARIKFPNGRKDLKGDVITHVLIAHEASRRGLQLNQKTGRYELPTEIKSSVSQLMERGVFDENDEQFILHMASNEVTDAILGKIYGMDLAVLENKNHGPKLIAEKLVPILHPELNQENVRTLPAKEQQEAKKKREQSLRLWEGDISVGLQRFEEPHKDKMRLIRMLGMLGLIFAPQIDQMMQEGLISDEQSGGRRGGH